MAIHVVYTRPMQVVDGQAINKNAATIDQMAKASMEMRVMADTSIPNSVGNPTIKIYLETEDMDGFSVTHINNTMIVTSDS